MGYGQATPTVTGTQQPERGPATAVSNLGDCPPGQVPQCSDATGRARGYVGYEEDPEDANGTGLTTEVHNAAEGSLPTAPY